MSARIHPLAHVDPSAILGDDVVVGPGCVVMEQVRIGVGTRLIANAVVEEFTQLGEDNVLHPGAVLGGGPQDQSHRGERTELRVGDGNVFREGVTINRGTVKGGGRTTVGDGNLFMACSHVGHDCRIGNRCVAANNVLLGGHVEMGDRVVIGGGAAFHHFVRIGRMAYIGGMTRVVHDCPPGLKVSGDPGRPRAVNVVGLQRAQVSKEDVDAVRLLYRMLFRGPAPLKTAAFTVDVPEDSLAGELVSFIREWVSSTKGRYLEDYRTDGEQLGRGSGG